MELRHLRYFVAVAAEENVSRAALRLHVSQPALSRQIRDLEAEIGYALFERSAKSIRLTEAGRTFYPEAQAVLQHAAGAVDRARAVAGGSRGEINVGYAPSLTVEILPRALRNFHDGHPGVRVSLHDLSTEEMLTRVATGQLDLAFSVRPPPRLVRGLNVEELARYPIVVVVAPGHPLARVRFAALGQLAGQPLIGLSRKEYPEYHQMLDRMFAATGSRPVLAGEHDGITSLVADVATGRGYALVPGCVSRMIGARLRQVPLKPSVPPIQVVALSRKGAASDLVQAFIGATGAVSRPNQGPRHPACGRAG